MRRPSASDSSGCTRLLPAALPAVRAAGRKLLWREPADGSATPTDAPKPRTLHVRSDPGLRADTGLYSRTYLTDERCRARMTSQIFAALIGALGALSGVITGSVLSAGYQRRAAARDQAVRSSDERRKVFAAFLAAAREWRALSVHPNTELVSASAISSRRHADGGAPATRTLGLRSEIALVARPRTIRSAYALVRVHGELAEGRGKHSAGNLPRELFVACRLAEASFTAAAREELGFPASEAELTEIFLSAAQTEQAPTSGS